MQHRIHMRTIFASLVFTSAVFVAACSTEKRDGSDSTVSANRETPAAASGDTIVVEAWSDGAGNYFKPKDIEAHPGDVVRFVLKSGVHNVHFLPDSNKIKTGLPPASELLQIPEQTHDMVISMQPGHYYFQCDPHAALGMTGKLEVEEKE